jgi:CTP synthase
MTKYIFISGGVISGLGKGITTASIALLLKSRGLKVTCVKCDAYMNVDAGTIRPQEHGEVFVTDDGVECDQDIGNYERFLGTNLYRANYITNGQIYQEVIRRERAFEYDGEDVEIVPHIPEEMIRRFQEAARINQADVVLIEIGGTVGEYQNILFIEANRIMKYRDHEDVIHVHVSYLPTPSFLGEMKSKPVQTSVRMLSSSGVMPDFIVGRADSPIDQPRKDRIAWLCNIDPANVISNPNVNSIYQLPLIFQEQHFDEKILKKLGIKTRPARLETWQKMVRHIETAKKILKIAVVGKYFAIGDFTLSDSYISVIEAVKHAAWQLGASVELDWISSERYEKDPSSVAELANYHGLVVPGGFGARGTEGIIKAIQFARENQLPFLGLCYGLQLALVEYARHICELKKANTTEIDPQTPHPVVDILPSQIAKLANKEYGGTMRLGAYLAELHPDSQVHSLYKKFGRLKSDQTKIREFAHDPVNKFRLGLTKKFSQSILERHRHRYEVSPSYTKKLATAGIVFSGAHTRPDGQKLVEFFELPGHPFFIGTQAHPEFKSRPLDPSPLFLGFIDSMLH